MCEVGQFIYMWVYVFCFNYTRNVNLFICVYFPIFFTPTCIRITSRIFKEYLYSGISIYNIMNL